MILTLIGVQDEYTATVNAGFARWEHRKQSGSHRMGHFNRIQGGARRKAEKQFRKLGFDDPKTIDYIIQQAKDMAELERNATA